MKRRALLPVAMAGALLASACGSSPEEAAFVQPPPSAAAAPVSSASSGTGKEAADAEAPPPPVTVPATLKFSGKTLDGRPFDATKLAGKPTILWFWAPWCATCASEAQSVRDLQDEFGGSLNFLGIAGMGNNKDMHQFVKDLEVSNVTHLDDQAGKIWKKFKITEQSLYVVLDRDGKVVSTGYLDDLQLTQQVKALVA
ncbi:redoxin domain-containing protein [Actinoplanes sp. TRM 88003]|uniref:Redoxin domain-containing protein n=1 Tax=Paractinoplanes aksuensis TaxID=2939490 RepID=A0ABT1DK27_9ACTN|nr:redoxin family protein [Actinoplanes aksuensis]MCO8271194.1 redoxin domain-containing protein [Actinoplanes aksuensis]